MNGVHDMGGMHGFDEVEKDDAQFHADWERTAFALNLLVRLQGVNNLDETRYATERMDPGEYLTTPYFGRWVKTVQRLCEEKGVLEEGAVEERTEAILAGEYEVPEREDPELAERAREMFESHRFSVVEDGPDPGFEAGDAVVVRNRHPEGHTRAPRYTRRAEGVVRKHYGAFPLADAAAEGREVPEPLYSVEFTHRELWGDEHDEADTLCIDMWESYLKPAEGDGE